MNLIAIADHPTKEDVLLLGSIMRSYELDPKFYARPNHRLEEKIPKATTVIVFGEDLAEWAKELWPEKEYVVLPALKFLHKTIENAKTRADAVQTIKSWKERPQTETKVLIEDVKDIVSKATKFTIQTKDGVEVVVGPDGGEIDYTLEEFELIKFIVEKCNVKEVVFEKGE